MRLTLQIISWLALALTVLPSLVYAFGNMELDRVKGLLLIATIVWFAVTPFWMGKKEES